MADKKRSDQNRILPLMATDPSLSNCPIPFKAIEEDARIASPRRRLADYDDLISGLPVIGGPLPERNYRGCWWPEATLPGIIATQRDLRPRPDDIFLVTYPKSGTTRLKALAFAAMTRARYPLTHHPLLTLNPHDCVASINELFTAGQADKIEALPSPRVLATHMPYSWLPDSVASSGCRIIYVCRDPKDAVVSGFHFVNKMLRPGAAKPLDFSSYFERFCEGTNTFGPIWDHVLGYWKESLRRPQKVLFLKYEEILEDPVANVKRLAEFVGCPFSAEEEKQGVVEEIIELCSFEKLTSLEVNKTGSRTTLFTVANAAFFRNGVSGDWRNHMSPEMAKRFDEIVLQKIEGSSLALPGVGLGRYD